MVIIYRGETSIFQAHLLLSFQVSTLIRCRDQRAWLQNKCSEFCMRFLEMFFQDHFLTFFSLIFFSFAKYWLRPNAQKNQPHCRISVAKHPQAQLHCLPWGSRNQLQANAWTGVLETEIPLEWHPAMTPAINLILALLVAVTVTFC